MANDDSPELVSEEVPAAAEAESASSPTEGENERPEPQGVSGDEAEERGESEQGLARDLEKLQALLDESTSRAAQTQERLLETHERYLRVAADFDNYKKRAGREREETVRYANERLLKDLLPVADNLERALAAPGETGALRQGVQLVLKQLGDVLGRFGVESFLSLGEPFDPARHEALMELATEEVPPGHVAQELVKGYTLNGRLLRPAAVAVAKRPPASAPFPAEPFPAPSSEEV